MMLSTEDIDLEDESSCSSDLISSTPKSMTSTISGSLSFSFLFLLLDFSFRMFWMKVSSFSFSPFLDKDLNNSGFSLSF